MVRGVTAASLRLVCIPWLNEAAVNFTGPSFAESFGGPSYPERAARSGLSSTPRTRGAPPHEPGFSKLWPLLLPAPFPPANKARPSRSKSRASNLQLAANTSSGSGRAGSHPGASVPVIAAGVCWETTYPMPQSVSLAGPLECAGLTALLISLDATEALGFHPHLKSKAVSSHRTPKRRRSDRGLGRGTR